MSWHRLAAIDDCPPGSGKEFVVGEQVIAIFNIGGDFFAIDGVCAHQGGPLAEGELTECIVTCPWHGWQFDVRTGQQQLNRNITQQQFETKVEDGALFVKLTDGGPE
jgi:nitrite reductase (NADH) small subunit